MKNQELAFRKSEGNKWFLRNLKKLQENSVEISLLCNWLMPFQNDINNILEILTSECQFIELNNILINEKNKESQTAITLNIKFSSYTKLDQLLLKLNENFPEALISTIDLNNF